VSYLSTYRPPHHLIGFSPQSIKLMAKHANLKVVKHIKKYDHLASMVLRKKKKIIYYPIALILYIANMIGLGTNQEIVLRKE
jgi:hypothetical protein